MNPSPLLFQFADEAAPLGKVLGKKRCNEEEHAQVGKEHAQVGEERAQVGEERKVLDEEWDADEDDSGHEGGEEWAAVKKSVSI